MAVAAKEGRRQAEPAAGADRSVCARVAGEGKTVPRAVSRHGLRGRRARFREGVVA